MKQPCKKKFVQENRKCVPGFDREAFLGEKELYSDHIIGCAVSATHYQDRRITDETLTKILELNHGCDPKKYPHLKRFIEDENLQKSYPNAQKELQTLAEIKNIFLKISASLEEKSPPEAKNCNDLEHYLHHLSFMQRSASALG